MLHHHQQQQQNKLHVLLQIKHRLYNRPNRIRMVIRMMSPHPPQSQQHHQTSPPPPLAPPTPPAIIAAVVVMAVPQIQPPITATIAGKRRY